MAQLYLLNARTLMTLADSVEGDAKTKARIRFAVQQWIDAASPSNYLALNPDALKKAIETQGESITTGVHHLLEDLQKGHVSQTDESVFEVGRNVATTAGTVVFENELFQLIEYKPLTAKVLEKPMLFVPPCINKYYILDLQPDNSVIRYTVEQGHRTFVVSWRNPDANAPKTPAGQGPRNPMRPMPGGKVVPAPGAPGAPGAVLPGAPPAPGGMGVQPVVPTVPPGAPAQPGADGKAPAPADAPAEGQPAKPANKGEGKGGEGKGETKSEGKAAEGKAP